MNLTVKTAPVQEGADQMEEEMIGSSGGSYNRPHHRMVPSSSGGSLHPVEVNRLQSVQNDIATRLDI
jgi:hypothetical protein